MFGAIGSREGLISHLSLQPPNSRQKELKKEKFVLTHTLEGTMVARVALTVAMEDYGTAYSHLTTSGSREFNPEPEIGVTFKVLPLATRYCSLGSISKGSTTSLAGLPATDQVRRHTSLCRSNSHYNSAGSRVPSPPALSLRPLALALKLGVTFKSGS